jgi:hypothetical protein
MMKLKKILPVSTARSEKITVPGEVAVMLDEYADYYAKLYQEKIGMGELIIEMLKAFMASDREFKKVVRDKATSELG